MAMEATTWETALCDGAVVMYVVSTTGDGDPPDNCASFYVGLKVRSNPLESKSECENSTQRVSPRYN
jgi:hypothetical protein